MTGFVLVDKPAGPTSHDVVSAARRALGIKRVGHAGTLDPPATGLVVLGVGPATRLLRYVGDRFKVYATVGVLGVTTSTLDADGEVEQERPVDVTEEDIREVVPRFTGRISQVPPAVSAIKIAGERAYEKARRGEDVQIEPREVSIHDLVLEGFGPPRFELTVRCSGGTYIRSLVADIGEALGCGAHVESLRRTAIGSLSVDDAVGMDAISPGAVVPVSEGLRDLPSLTVGAEDARRARNGQRLEADAPTGELLVIGPDGAVGVFHADGGILRPVTVLGGGG